MQAGICPSRYTLRVCGGIAITPAPGNTMKSVLLAMGAVLAVGASRRRRGSRALWRADFFDDNEEWVKARWEDGELTAPGVVNEVHVAMVSPDSQDRWTGSEIFARPVELPDDLVPGCEAVVDAWPAQKRTWVVVNVELLEEHKNRGFGLAIYARLFEVIMEIEGGPFVAVSGGCELSTTSIAAGRVWTSLARSFDRTGVFPHTASSGDVYFGPSHAALVTPKGLQRLLMRVDPYGEWL